MRIWIVNQIKWILYIYSNLGFWNGLKYRLAEVFRKPTIKVSVNGTPLVIRPRSPDLRVAVESLGSEFEPIRDFLPKDFEGVIIDAGAYIGSAALKLSDMYPHATIVSIEAAGQNFNLLRQNVGRNPRIDTIKAALTSRSGVTLDLKDRGTGHWGFTTIQSPNDNPDALFVESVDTITIKDIISSYPDREIGLIKLDIEGGEKILFLDSAKELSKIPLIFVELHDRIVSGCSDAFKDHAKNRTIFKFRGEKYLSYANLETAVSA